jgi:hypothetical protein
MDGQRIEIPAPETPPLTQSQVEALEADSGDEHVEQTKAPVAPPVEPAPAPEAPTPEANQNPLEKFSKEFADTGAISEASFAELDKLGYPRSVVEQYIEGARAIASKQQTEIYGLVGGEQAYGKLVEWAAEAMAPDEIEAYNKVISGNDPATVKFAVQSLRARYESAAGTKEPRFVAASGRSAPSGYESVAQLMEAMGDPRYKTDEAFRNEVARKLSVSSIM